MKRNRAAMLAAGFCLLGFALGRFSALWGGAVLYGAGRPLPLAPLQIVEPSGPDDADGGFGPVDINAAGVDELCLLPGIGPKTAEKIIAYREKNGPFASPEELQAVDGIGPVTFENMKNYVDTGR